MERNGRSLGERVAALNAKQRGVALALIAVAVAVLTIGGAMALSGNTSTEQAEDAADGQVDTQDEAQDEPQDANQDGVPDEPASTVPEAAPGEPENTASPDPRSPTTSRPDRPSVGTPGRPTPTSTAAPDNGDETPNQPQSPRRLNVSASAEQVDPREYVTFSATNLPGGTRNVIWSYGNGATSCLDIGERPTRAYRAPGTYTVRAVALGAACGARPAESAPEGTVDVTVMEGPTTSNGPAGPSVDASPGPSGVLPEDPHVQIEVTTGDPDGYISRVVVDWDDGSAPDVTEFPLTGCSDTPTTWPASLRTRTYQHDYMTAGTYDVTVTVTSVGCDGLSPQEGVEVLRITPGGMAGLQNGPGSFVP